MIAPNWQHPAGGRRRNHWIRLAIAGLLLAGGCSRAPDKATDAGRAMPPPPGQATNGWSGAVLRGNSRAALQAYLNTVDEIRPTRFRVEWNPATVAVDKAAALRSLRAVSRDGSTFTFSADEPALAKLHSGSILWIWDIALRKVDSVQTSGEVTRVHTSAVSLTEAMPNAELEFSAPVALQKYYVAREQEAAEPAATAHVRRLARGFRYASLTDLPPENLPDPDSYASQDDDDWYDEGMAADGFTKEKNGWTYSIGYRTRPGGISVELQARKGDIGGGDGTGGSKNVIPEYKKIELDRKAADEAMDKAIQELREEEKGVRDTDADFQQQMKELQQDQANRNNPAYTGPRPPPQVNEYGHPITDQAAQQRLRDQWQKKHDLEIQKLQATEQILGEWRNKKEEIDARKRALKVAAGVAKQLWDIVSDTLDARIRARVDLDGFAAGAQLAFVNGDIDTAATHFRDLNGKVHAQLIGRLGKPGNEATKVPVMHVPVSFNVPMPVGGIPFVVQVSADFSLTMALSGMHATLTAEGETGFKGDGGFTYAKGKASYDDSFHSSEPTIGNTAGTSPGVSAVVLGVQLPRLGMGVGIFGVSSVAFVDVVNVITITQAGSVGAGMLAPVCRRTSYNTVGHVGVKTDILALPFASTVVDTSKLSPKKEIFNTKTQKLEPPVKACEIG